MIVGAGVLYPPFPIPKHRCVRDYGKSSDWVRPPRIASFHGLGQGSVLPGVWVIAQRMILLANKKAA
jgi:hypothetical protein